MRLIDADALIETVHDITHHPDNYMTVREIEYTVEREPTVGGWISVKDRLPEEHADEDLYEFEQFLCATVWDNVRMVGFGTRIGDDKPHFWSGNSIWDNWVTHWQPLPEPPEEVANGEPD